MTPDIFHFFAKNAEKKQFCRFTKKRSIDSTKSFPFRHKKRAIKAKLPRICRNGICFVALKNREECTNVFHSSAKIADSELPDWIYCFLNEAFYGSSKEHLYSFARANLVALKLP